MVVHPSDDLRLPTSDQPVTADDVELPQLHRLLALPPQVILPPTPAGLRVDEPVPHHHPLDRAQRRHRTPTPLPGPTRTPTGAAPNADGVAASRRPWPRPPRRSAAGAHAADANHPPNRADPRRDTTPANDAPPAGTPRTPW